MKTITIKSVQKPIEDHPHFTGGGTRANIRFRHKRERNRFGPAKARELGMTTFYMVEHVETES